MFVVYMLNGVGERTPPCGMPVLNDVVRMRDFDMLCVLCVPSCSFQL